ncbi:MAG: winged helix-turn-helix transcriptional regulator [Candidatus Methanofastidiosia archaeon]|jgi:DNA-binding HxlR family transcriptional regulator
MEDKDVKDLLRILGMKATVDILEYVDKHGTAQYKDLQDFVSTHTLNARLQDLREFNLLEHHFVREDTRKEWYESTEKGKKVLEWISALEKIT